MGTHSISRFISEVTLSCFFVSRQSADSEKPITLSCLSVTERMMAAKNPLSLTDRPHQLFADAPPPAQPPAPAPPTAAPPPPPPVGLQQQPPLGQPQPGQPPLMPPGAIPTSGKNWELRKLKNTHRGDISVEKLTST